jgi:hypothetical protein
MKAPRGAAHRSLRRRAALDFIAQDQDVDAGENGTVSHSSAPPDTGVSQVKVEYTLARPDEEQRLAQAAPGTRRQQRNAPVP